MNNIAKKLFALASASAMVFASMPLVASAAPHAAGSVFILPGSGTVYFINSTNQKQPFTSAGAFLSYGFLSWSHVVQGNAEDAALPTGAFVPAADGALIQQQGTLTVYLVTGGQKAGFTSADNFTGLGYSFSRVKVGDVSFMISAPLINSTAIAHPAGTLVNQAGTVYYNSAGGKLGIPSISVFNSWGFSFSDVVPSNSYDAALTMSGVMAALTPGQLMPTSSTVILPPPPPPVGSLSVALASTTPVAQSLVVDASNGGQALATLGTYNFTASSGAVQVNGVNFRRIGISSDSNINNAYLYQGNTRLASVQSISNGVLTFTSSTGLFTVAAGTTTAVSVKVDLAASTGAGQTIGVSLNAAGDITLASGTASGTFPINSNLMTVATVTNLGKIIVTDAGVTGTTSTASAVAAPNYEVWRFQLQAVNQNIAVSRMAFTNIGSVLQTDIQNLKLFDGGTQIGSTVLQQDNSRMVIFDLSATPYVITSGVTKNISLRADLVAGASRTFQYTFQSSSDIMAVDQQYNVTLFPQNSSTLSASFPVVKPANAVTISQGTMAVAKTTDSPTGNVALNGTGVTLAKYSFTASGENIKVTSLTLAATVTSSHTLKNVKVFLQTGTGTPVQVGTTASSVTGADSSANNPVYNFGNSFIVNAGTISNVTVVADLTGSTVTTDTVSIALKAGSSNAQGLISLTSLNVPAADTASNTLTISTSTLSASKNVALASVTTVGGATSQIIGSWLLTAGAAEGINLNTVTIVDRNAADAANGANGFGAAFNNLKLFYNGVQIPGSNVIVNPSSTAGTTQTFSWSPALAIPIGGSIQVDLRADVISSPTWTATDASKLTTATSGSGATTGTTVSLGTATIGQGITISSAGTITVALDGSTPPAQQIVMGSTAVPLGVWQFSANNVEGLNINQIIVNSVTTVGGDVQNLKLQVGGQTVATMPALSAATNGSATFGSPSSNLFTIPVNSSVRVTLVADVTNTTNATGNSALTPNFQTPASITGATTNVLISRGASSGTFATLANASTTYAANSSYAFRTKPVAVASTIPGSATGRVRQANDTVFKMNVAANAAFQVAFRAAALNNASATTDTFSGGFSTAAGTGWAVTNGGTDNGTLGTDSTNKVVASTSLKYTAGGTTGGASGMTFTIPSSGTVDVSGYNGFAVWLRDSQGNASHATTITLTGATAGSHTYTAADTGWHLAVVPFTGATTPFTGLTAITAFRVVSTSAASSTYNVGGVYFYKEFLQANFTATANGPSNTAAAPVLVTAKDNDSGTTFAAGNVDMTTANTTGKVYFFPTTEFDISAGGNRNISLVTDTSSLLSASANIAFTLSLGPTASSVTSPSGFVWYDGKVTQTATGPVSVYWADTNPNVVQPGSLGY